MPPLSTTSYSDNVSSWLKDKDQENMKSTDSPSTPQVGVEMQLTDITEAPPSGNIPIKMNEEPDNEGVSINYSTNYVSFNTESFVNKLIIELEGWVQAETGEALPYISNIKDISNEFEKYLINIPENRLLLALVKLLLTGDNWELISNEQVKNIKNELLRFRDGGVSLDDLQKFSNQMFRMGVTPITAN